MSSPDPGFDSGSSDVGTDQSSSLVSADSSTDQSQALNPSWEPVLKDLPEIFHEKLKGHFRSWDDNYRGLETKHKQLEEQYAPYKSYLGVDPQAIQYGLTMLQRVQQNPLEMYNNLRQYVQNQGLLRDEQAGQQQSQQDTEGLDQDPWREEFERRQQQLDSQQQNINTYIQQQTYEREVETNAQDVDQQVQSVIKKYGHQAVNVDDLLMRMYVQAQQQNGNFDAEAAYQQQLSTFKQLFAQQNGTSRPAPNVLSPGGTTPPTQEMKPEDMNEEQRAAYFKQLLDFANSNSGG